MVPESKLLVPLFENPSFGGIFMFTILLKTCAWIILLIAMLLQPGFWMLVQVITQMNQERSSFYQAWFSLIMMWII
jgi:hypothetical protein